MQACKGNLSSVIPMLTTTSVAVLGSCSHNALVATYAPGRISWQRFEGVSLDGVRFYENGKSVLHGWKVVKGFELIHKPSTQLQARRLRRPISGKAAAEVGAVVEPGDVMGASRSDRFPEVVGSPGMLEGALMKTLSEARKPYEPFFLFKNCHVDTLFAAFFRSLPNIKYRRECLRMADGGTVALDWPLMDINNPIGATLILLPGLTGGSDDTYVQHLLRRACKHGWNVVVFNSRGCADSPVTTPQFYSASFTEDLRQVVKYVGTCFPTSRLYAAGWSLGANILVRYLGQDGEHCPLSGAVSLCNPFDLVEADKDFHKGFNNVYDKALARGLQKIFKKHAALFANIGGEYNIPKVAAATSVRDFDDGLTRVSFGYSSVDDYYYDASSSHSIKEVKIPLLCIQAANDPISPARGIPRADIEVNPNCLLVVTAYGGHLGWVAGNEAPFGSPWTDPLVMQYLEALENLQSDQPAFQKVAKQGGDVETVSVEIRESGHGGSTVLTKP